MSIAVADFSCRLCGSKDLRYYYAQGNAKEFVYYRCSECSLVNYDLRGGLDQEQYLDSTDPLDDGDKRNRDKDLSWKFIRRWVPIKGKFFDIGCGAGRLLHLARADGWEVKGLELLNDAAEMTSQNLGVEVIVADFLAGIPEEEGVYDLVSLRHVLEHLEDPILALRKVNALLKPGGHCLLEMPNIEGLDLKIKRFFVNKGLYQHKYSDNYVPGHCNEFCRQSLERLLGVTGFKLVRWETYSKKVVSNFVVNRIHIGNKARALIRKTHAEA